MSFQEFFLFLLLSNGDALVANALSLDEIYSNAIEKNKIKYLNIVICFAIIQLIVLVVCAVIRYSPPQKNINVFWAFIPVTFIVIKTVHFYGAIYWILFLVELAILALLRRLSFFSTPEKLLEIEKKETKRIVNEDVLFSNYRSFDKSIIIGTNHSSFDSNFWKSEFRKNTTKNEYDSETSNSERHEDNSGTFDGESHKDNSGTSNGGNHEDNSGTKSFIDNEQEVCFSNCPKSFSSSSTISFSVSFKGIKPGDSVSWQAIGHLRLVKAEFEIKKDQNAVAEFRYEAESTPSPMLAIIVKYEEKNYLLNYVNEGDFFVLTK